MGTKMYNNTMQTGHHELFIKTDFTTDAYSYGYAKGFITAYVIMIIMLMFRRMLAPLI